MFIFHYFINFTVLYFGWRIQAKIFFYYIQNLYEVNQRLTLQVLIFLYLIEIFILEILFKTE